MAQTEFDTPQRATYAPPAPAPVVASIRYTGVGGVPVKAAPLSAPKALAPTGPSYPLKTAPSAGGLLFTGVPTPPPSGSPNNARYSGLVGTSGIMFTGIPTPPPNVKSYSGPTSGSTIPKATGTTTSGTGATSTSRATGGGGVVTPIPGISPADAPGPAGTVSAYGSPWPGTSATQSSKWLQILILGGLLLAVLWYARKRKRGRR